MIVQIETEELPDARRAGGLKTKIEIRVLLHGVVVEFKHDPRGLEKNNHANLVDVHFGDPEASRLAGKIRALAVEIEQRLLLGRFGDNSGQTQTRRENVKAIQALAERTRVAEVKGHETPPQIIKIVRYADVCSTGTIPEYGREVNSDTGKILGRTTR